MMARKAKQLVDEKGILSMLDPNLGPQSTVDIVTCLYESDETSRLMPSKKDCLTARKPDGRVQVHKRLVLRNLRENYRMFKDKFPNVEIGFSKFACLRPRYCILAGASGTHYVCMHDSSEREVDDAWYPTLWKCVSPNVLSLHSPSHL